LLKTTGIYLKTLIPVLVLLLTASCGGSGSNLGSNNIEQSVIQGSRILGMDVKNTALVDYATAYGQATTLGVREVSVSLDWALFEPATVGIYTDPDDILPALDTFYPTQAGDVTLVLRPLDTPGPRLPTDLTGLTFDNPLVINAFRGFLTHLHSQLPTLNASGKLKWIHVGNEIDATLGSSITQWSQWQTFFNAAKARIEFLWGTDVVVSSIVQYSALTDNSIRPRYLNFLPRLDSAALTYYPLNGDFTVKTPSVVATDFDFIASTIINKPILLQECGYPSGTLNNSSESQQAEFVTAVFDAWDTHRDRISLIDFAWQYDVDEATVNQWVIDFGMSGLANEDKFRSYLGTLGLSNNDSTKKLALQRLKDELQTRSWAQ